MVSGLVGLTQRVVAFSAGLRLDNEGSARGCQHVSRSERRRRDEKHTTIVP